MYFDLMENFKRALDANNIGIPFPQMDVHLYRTEDASPRRNNREGGLGPFFIAIFPVLVRQPFTLSPLYRYWRQADMRFRKLQPVTNRCGRNSEKLNKSR